MASGDGSCLAASASDPPHANVSTKGSERAMDLEAVGHGKTLRITARRICDRPRPQSSVDSGVGSYSLSERLPESDSSLLAALFADLTVSRRL
jgi:hypothetical protein